MQKLVATTTGLLALANRPDDTETIVEFSGTYTTLTFTVQGSVEGSSYSAKACVDDATGLVVAGGSTLAPANSSTVSYRIPSGGLSNIGINITGLASGSVTVSWHSSKGGGPMVANPTLKTPLPNSQFTTAALSSTTAAAGQLSGAANVFMANTGATPGTYTTRTAAQMFADIPNCVVGLTYTLVVSNAQATGTLTLAGGTGVTITGTATIAGNVSRTYQVTVTGATTIVMTNTGSGVAP